MKRLCTGLAACFLVLGLTANTWAAPLPTGTLLTIEPACEATGGPCPPGSPSGSWYGIDAYATGDPDQYVTTYLFPGLDGGILVGVDQPPIPYTGPYVGPTPGPGGIDSAGLHYTLDASQNIFDFSSGSVVLNDWWVVFNEQIIQLGGGVVTSAVQAGNSYTLEYLATVPPTVPAWGNVPYLLHLEGQIIPEPATLLLIGTGLAGLLGVMRKKG